MSSVDQESFDVVVVGARIAGSSLSVQLARRGFSVLLVDRAEFPSDTLSTHLIQVSGVRLMQQLGVLDKLEETGAPFLTSAVINYEGIILSAPVLTEPGWPAGGISVNRSLLDSILLDAARDAGVQVRTRTSLTALVRDAAGRVSGVRLRDRTGCTTVGTRLVIGADGRNSRVAQLVGARTYNVTGNQRFVYWAEFEGAREDGSARLHQHRDHTNVTIGFASDNGKFVVMVTPGLDDFARFKKGLPATYDAAVEACAPLRAVLAGARRVGRPIGTAYTPGYFRESAGPGWALIGDAGHFKDPLLGQGISDALRQAEALASHLAGVGTADAKRVDRQLRRWHRWRDTDAAPMYWLGWDFAKAGPLPALERSLTACISADPAIRQRFVDGVMSHRVSPDELINPSLMANVARHLHGTGMGWAEIGLVMGRRLALELYRRARLRWPKYAPLPKPSGAASAHKTCSGNVWAGDIEDGTETSSQGTLSSSLPGKPMDKEWLCNRLSRLSISRWTRQSSGPTRTGSTPSCGRTTVYAGMMVTRHM